MADAVVLTPDQIQQMLAAQAAQSQSQSQPQPQSSKSASAPSKPRIKTSFKKQSAFQPFYTGGPVAFTPDGELMAASMDQDLVIVQVDSAQVLKRIHGDSEEITAIAISPNGSHLIAASRSLAVRTYSLPDLELVRSTPKTHSSQINLMAIDPTSTLLATASSDGTVRVWDIHGGYCTHSFSGHGGIVSALSWNMPSPAAETKKSKAKPAPNNNRRRIELFTGSVDGKIRLWDLTSPNTSTNKPAATLSGHVSVVRGIAITDDGHTLVSGARDRSIILWRLQNDVWKLKETLAADETIESVGFLAPGTIIGSSGRNADQTIFYSGGSDGQIRLWDTSSASVIAREPKSLTEVIAQNQSSNSADKNDQDDDDENETRAITALHYIKATSSLASVHADQNVAIRSVASDSSLPPLSLIRQMVGFNDEIVDLALVAAQASDQETHLAVATNSNAIRLYTLGSHQHTVDLLHGHTDVVLCLDRSPDMRWIASGGKDRSARIWAWLPASRLPNLVASTLTDESGSKLKRGGKKHAETSEADSGQWVCVAVCQGHAESVGAIAFARRPTNAGDIGAPFMVTASQDRTAKIWDLSALSALLNSDEVVSAPIKLKSLLTLKIHDKDINCLDVSPNNALLASGSQDRTAKVFQLSFTPPSKANGHTASAQLKPLATLKGHKRGVWSVRFSSADLALATGSGDRTIRLWGLREYNCIKIFEGHTNSVLKLQFCSAGMQLISSASDGLVKLWNVKEEECVETLDGHEDKVWSIVLSRDESSIFSAAADSVINIWQDTTESDELEKARAKEEMVTQEQDFANFLTLKDYRNAVALALSMKQPRRLLGLFTQVSASRPEGDGATSAGLLLDSALGRDSSGASTKLADGNIVALQQAGVLASSAVPVGQASCSRRRDGDEDATSITGLKAVDAVLSSLSDGQLVQLFGYVRDWNTSGRTSGVAQTVLHALLRSYSSERIIEAFEGREQMRREQEAKRLEEMENGVVSSKTEAQEAERRKVASRTARADLASMLDGLLPYTERHYARADRTLIESAMIEFTLSSMDAILGPAAAAGEEDAEDADADVDVDMDMDMDLGPAGADSVDRSQANAEATFGELLSGS